MRNVSHGLLVLGLLPTACAGSSSSPKPAAATPAPTPTASAASPVREATAPPSPPGSASTPKGSDSLPASIAVSKAHADGNHYALDAKGPGLVSVGGDGEIEIVLSAKDHFFVSDKHPYKLATTVDPVGAVQFEQTELGRSKATFTKTEARWKARFKGTKSGAARVGGTLSFSVCKRQDCVVENVEIVVPVTIR
jgi:hypothetical protein